MTKLKCWPQFAAALLIVGLFGSGCGASTPQGLPKGQRYVMQCRKDGHEFEMSPQEMNAAFERGEVRGSGDGVDLFRCPKCGEFAAQQIIREK
ncbi:MAG: hypothetical protein N2652_00840 [Kiritimatiellae bacterium]|nr:hypothetical protein [Kiritimatiellia bacterium]